MIRIINSDEPRLFRVQFEVFVRRRPGRKAVHRMEHIEAVGSMLETRQFVFDYEHLNLIREYAGSRTRKFQSQCIVIACTEQFVRQKMVALLKELFHVMAVSVLDVCRCN